MRVLVANDGVSDVGGVQTYLDAVLRVLSARGHAVAIAYCTDNGNHATALGTERCLRFDLGGSRRPSVLDAVRRWAPHVCFVHNMRDLSVDRALSRLAPVVKFMHGYAGTCIGGQKMYRFPRAEACDRALGSACVALYPIRGCGKLSPSVLIDDLRWAREQQRLFADYAALVVASDHMRREYVTNGAAPETVHVNPLFPTHMAGHPPMPPPQMPTVAFLGRMTRLKGGDLLLAAVRHAAGRLNRGVALLMVGDGPQRDKWEALARRLDVPCTFTGWIDDDRRWQLLRGSSVVALPSTWPEPFGLVGLEAGALGVPAIASDVGGVREWLRDGVNGVIVPAPLSAQSFGDALAALLADPARQALLRRGAQRVAAEMSVGSHVDRLEALFRAVAKKSLSDSPLAARSGVDPVDRPFLDERPTSATVVRGLPALGLEIGETTCTRPR